MKNHNKIQKIGNIVFAGFVILLLLLLLFPLLPIKGGYEMFVVMSGSMEPTIKTGSVVVVKPESKYNVSDIVTFGKKSEAIVTHRIVSEQNGQFTTKGDANETEDIKKITRRDVVGRVIFSLAYLGYLVAFVREPIGFGMLVVLPALYIIIIEIINIVKELNKKKQKDA